MAKNNAAKLHEIASTLKSDAFIIQYISSSGYISPENRDRIKTVLLDIENGLEQMKEIAEGDFNGN
jgi:hypothetical protein